MEIMTEKNEILKKAWEERCKLIQQGNKIFSEGDGLYRESVRLREEGNKLWMEGSNLWTEGDNIFEKCILEVYGNIKFKWKNYSKEKDDCECHLETGEVFNP